jgi:hypothetical protein
MEVTLFELGDSNRRAMLRINGDGLGEGNCITLSKLSDGGSDDFGNFTFF